MIDRMILAIAGMLMAVLMAPAASPDPFKAKAKAALALAPDPFKAVSKSGCAGCGCPCEAGECTCKNCGCANCPAKLTWHLCTDGRYHLYKGEMWQGVSRAPMAGERGYKAPRAEACSGGS